MSTRDNTYLEKGLNAFRRLYPHVGQETLEQDYIDILKKVMRVIVDIFELQMAWIGVVEEGTFNVKPIDSVGFEADYLKSLKVTWNDSKFGLGPTGMAIKTNRPVIQNNIKTDPTYEPWKEEALRRGCRSSAAFPILSPDYRRLGALNLYSSLTEFFDEETVQDLQALIIHGTTTTSLQLLEKSEYVSRRLEALHRHVIELAGAENIGDIVDITLDAMERSLGFSRGAMLLVEEDTLRDVKLRGLAEERPYTLPLSGKGLTVKAVKTGESVLVPDVRLDPDYIDVGVGIKSELVSPVKIGDEVVAVLNTESTRLAAYTEQDQKLLEVLASHVASSIARIRYVAELMERDEKLAALHYSALNFHRVEDVTDIGNQAMNTVKKILGFENAGFAIVDSDVIQFISVMGLDLPLPIKIPLDGKGIIARVARAGEPSLINDVRLDEDYLPYAPNQEFKALSELTVPVKINGEVAAVLNIESVKLNAFDDQDLRRIEILAAHVSAAFSSLQRRQELLEFESKLTALHGNAARLASAESLGEVAEVAIDSMKQTLGVEVASYMAVEDERLVTVAIEGAEMLGLSLPLEGPGVTVKAVRTGETQFIPDTRKEPDYVGGSISALSELAVPVKLDGDVVAVLNVESTKANAYDHNDVTLIETLAIHVASTLRRFRNLKQLLESEERLRIIAEGSFDGIFTLDLEGRFTYASPSAETITGYGTEEIVGRYLQDFLPKSEVPKAVQAIAELEEGRDIKGLQLEILRKDGSSLSVEWNAFPMLSEGLIVGAQGIVRDVTKQRLEEEEMKKLIYRLNGLEPGGCYISESKERCLKAYAYLTRHGVSGLCIAREDPEKLVVEYGLKAEEVMILSSRPMMGYPPLIDLQALSIAISNRIKTGESVIFLDGLAYLLSRFNFDRVFNFIQEKRFQILEAGAVLLLYLDWQTVSEREKALLRSELKILT